MCRHRLGRSLLLTRAPCPPSSPLPSTLPWMPERLFPSPAPPFDSGCHLSLACDHNGARDSYWPFCCGPIRWTLYFLYLTSFSLTLLPFFASSSTQPLSVDIPEGWGLGLWRPRRSAAQSFRAGRSRHRSRLGGPAAEFQRRPCPFWE